MQKSLEKGGRKELMSPPITMSYYGRVFLRSISPFFMSQICGLFFSAFELRCAEMKMQLSSTKNALLYAQFKLSRCSLLNLPKIRSVCLLRSYELSNEVLNEDYLAIIIVSFDSSMLMMCSLRLTRQLQKNYENSWKKKTSDYNFEKLSTIFFTFRYSFKKESSQKGRWVFRQISGSLLSASSMVSTLQTYFSIVWQVIKSYILVASFSEL